MNVYARSVQPQTVGSELFAGNYGGHGFEVILVQRHTDTAVDGQVQRCVALAPVLDRGNVGGRSAGHHEGV